VFIVFWQADVVNVTPGTQYSVTVTAVSSSNISPGVSRMINTNESRESFGWVSFLSVKVPYGSLVCPLLFNLVP